MKKKEPPISKPSISIFFPCYNDEKSIASLVKKAFLILKKIAAKYEVIVVDDGSTDKSRSILQKLSLGFPKLRLIYHQRNFGYGAALTSGFKTAQYKLIFYTDGDGQYDISELSILLSLMSSDVNFINGIKIARHDPNYRIVIGNFYSFLARWFFWLPIHDVDCDFRLIRKNLLNRFDLNSKSGTVCIELVKKAQRNGGKFREVSIHHLERKFGISQFFQVNHLLRTLWELASLWLKLMVLRGS